MSQRAPLWVNPRAWSRAHTRPSGRKEEFHLMTGGSILFPLLPLDPTVMREPAPGRRQRQGQETTGTVRTFILGDDAELLDLQTLNSIPVGRLPVMEAVNFLLFRPIRVALSVTTKSTLTTHSQHKWSLLIVQWSGRGGGGGTHGIKSI